MHRLSTNWCYVYYHPVLFRNYQLLFHLNTSLTLSFFHTIKVSATVSICNQYQTHSRRNMRMKLINKQHSLCIILSIINPWNGIISSFPSEYHSTATNNILGIVEGRLAFYEPVPTTINQICRIVVPISLRQTIFSLLYTSLAAGYMEEYKILYRIKWRFISP